MVRNKERSDHYTLRDNKLNWGRWIKKMAGVPWRTPANRKKLDCKCKEKFFRVGRKTKLGPAI